MEVKLRRRLQYQLEWRNWEMVVFWQKNPQIYNVWGFVLGGEGEKESRTSWKFPVLPALLKTSCEPTTTIPLFGEHFAVTCSYLLRPPSLIPLGLCSVLTFLICQVGLFCFLPFFSSVFLSFLFFLISLLNHFILLPSNPLLFQHGILLPSSLSF